MTYIITTNDDTFIDEVDTLAQAEEIAALNTPATITEQEDNDDNWGYSDEW